MKIVIDGVFFQIRNTGIARVWRSLLSHWSTQPFAQSIVLLDRGKTAPKFESIQSLEIPLYGQVGVEEDRQLLQKYCDQVGADLFVSTYYTTPVSTPSVFFGHDMIPELMGVDLTAQMWRDKHRAIHQAIAHIVVSENTKKDLQKLFPKTRQEPITVAHCGLSPEFSPPSPETIKAFRDRYQLDKPYVLWVGERLGVNGYKNSALVFQAMQEWMRGFDYAVVCTGDGSPLEPPLAELATGLDVRSLKLSEAELVAAYGGAHCLAYTSRYEGFGLPLLEAMGCDCPVVTCPCGSIPEVAGKAALFVPPDDPLVLKTAFERLVWDDHRRSLIKRGRARSRRFSWATMADTVADALTKASQIKASQKPMATEGNSGNNRDAVGVAKEEAVGVNDPSNLARGAAPANVNQAIAIIKAYSQTPQNRELLAQVRSLRQRLITPALQLGTSVRVAAANLDQLWSGEYATLHQALRHSGLLNEPLDSGEEGLLNRLLTMLPTVPDNDMPRLMALLTAATLLRYPYQLPGLDRDWSQLNTVASRYVVLLLDMPDYFGEAGALERYREYTEGLWRSLRIQVLRNRNDLTWQKIAQRLMNYGSITPLYFSENTGREVYRDRAQITETALESAQPEPLDWSFNARPSRRTKIRIGILRNHWLPGTESFSTLPVFEYLDRDRFEVVLYTLHATANDMEHYCGEQVAGMVALPSSLPEQVNVIRTADLDILWIGTNVTMVTNGITLLSAFRLARVQVTSINSPTTTGFRNVDLYFGGQLSLGASYGAYHETAIALPGSGICFSRPPQVETFSQTFPTRQDWGADDNTVVLISGANFNKLLPELRATWTRILAAIPNSRLVLYPYNPNWQHHYPGDRFRQDFATQLQAAGVDPERLVILQPMAGMADIRQCLRQGDLYLDSLPYGGATSLLDPIDVDLPMVVYEGEALRFRQAPSLLRELNEPILQEIIATTADEYVATAIALTQSPARRQAIAQALVKAKANKLPFLDSRRYSRAIAPILETLVTHWTQTQVPALASSAPSSPSATIPVVDTINRSPLPSDRLVPLTLGDPKEPTTPKLAGPAVPPLSTPPALTQPQLQQLAGALNLWRIAPDDVAILEQVRQWRSLIADAWETVHPHQAQQQFQQIAGQAYQILAGSSIQKLPWDSRDQFRANALVSRIQANPSTGDRLGAYMVAMLYFQPSTFKIDQAKTRLPEWLYPIYANLFEPAPNGSATQPVSPGQPMPLSQSPPIPSLQNTLF
ncbi:MAG: glycosyltransferase [Cyanobacteria bacterium P01_D01_bin.73]